MECPQAATLPRQPVVDRVGPLKAEQNPWSPLSSAHAQPRLTLRPAFYRYVLGAQRIFSCSAFRLEHMVYCWLNWQLGFLAGAMPL
jgi:hypothetical protein